MNDLYKILASRGGKRAQKTTNTTKSWWGAAWGAENKRQKNPQPQIPQNELYVSSVPLTTFPVFYPYATPEACSAVRHATRSAAHQQVPPGRCKHTAHPTSWYPSGRKSPSPLLLAWSLSWLFVFVLVPKYYN
jgi:hypothetical protein